jgi:hypothetical protein
MSSQGNLDWRVSQACEGGACIQIARRGESILIGNTSQPEGPIGEFTTDEWRRFLIGAKSGEFDDIA